MMRRKTFIAQTLVVCLCLGALFSVSCSGNSAKEDLAAKAAKEYYDALISGRYGEYVKGFANSDSLPPTYEEQLMVNAKQFMAQQKEEHGGIVDVRAVYSRTDSLQGTTEAFLLLCFSDSTKEEVVVPMVQLDNVWKMK